MKDSVAARLALFCQYAMDMGRTPVNPPADPRLAPDWKLRGYIVGVDEFLGLSERVCYGFLAESTGSPGQFIAVTRGTNGTLEWIEDAEFALQVLPAYRGAEVESGFFGVYRRLEYLDVDGTTWLFAATGIAYAIGSGSVQVIGHSLGAALATYLTLDLALMGRTVSGHFFASPHPGDQGFADYFELNVSDYQLYNYDPDLVPKVPAGPDYAHLKRAVIILPADAQAAVHDNPECNHHVLCYSAMLDYSAADWTTMTPKDKSLTACISGPASS